MTKDTFKQARSLVNEKDFGILSTISVKLDGYPFGSVVPYCLDDNGMPIVYISTIAQHTINIKANDRCSLSILKDHEDVQANGRICIIGHLDLIEEDNNAETDAPEGLRAKPRSTEEEWWPF